MVIIDTHTHLYSKELAHDLADVIERATSEGVRKFFLPGIDSTEIESMLALEENYPGKCFAMMGLHPCSVKENHQDELRVVGEWLKKRPFAAIGEIGLDFYWDKTFMDAQYACFAQQIEWSLGYDMPIVIHTRNAMKETVAVVKEYASKNVRGIFHCFSGNAAEADAVIEAGFLLGIGGVVTFKNSGVAEAIKHISLSKMVVETDSPYLSPVPFRGKRNESSYIKYVINKLAEIKNVTTEEVAAITTANAEAIFNTG